MTAADVAEVLFSVTLVSWFIVEVIAAWSQRPPVVYDPWTGHWRAQRGMEARQPTRRPLTMPPAGSKMPRLRVVDDLAS